MVDGRRGHLTGLAVLILGVAFAIGGSAGGSLTWETELAIQTIDPIVNLDESFSRLQADYAWGDVALGSSGAFGGSIPSLGTGENGAAVAGAIVFPLVQGDRGAAMRFSGYAKDDLVIDWPVGTYGFTADVSFGITPAAFKGLSATGNVTAYGTSTTIDFSLVPVAAAFATGLTLEVSGTLLSGMGVTTTVHFGAPMGPGAPPANPCALDFSSAELFLDGFPWCCVYVGLRTVFDCEGFDRAEIDFDLSALDGVLSLDGDLVFQLQTKTLTLTPQFQFGADACVWVNVGVDPEVVWGSSGRGPIEAIVVRGFGVTGCDVGAAEFGMIASIAGGLYKSKGANDIGIRANGYYIALDPSVAPNRYEETDYDMVLTLEHGFNNAELAVDVYFDPDASRLFDLALITAEYVYRLSSSFEFSLGFGLDPVGGLHRFVVGLGTSTTLP